MGLIEDLMFPIPNWINTDPGEYKCNKCSYSSDNEEYLQNHCDTFHKDKVSYVLYMECSDSIEGRNHIVNNIPFSYIDCTGGQASFEDGDIEEFYQAVKKVANEYNLELGLICRMPDPGLGLIFSGWLVEEGIKAGTITIPKEKTTLLVASEKGWEDICLKLVEDPECEINVESGEGKNPLAYAITYNMRKFCQALIKRPECNINKIYKYMGLTPLMVACLLERENIGLMILEREDCDVSIKADDDRTALDIANEYGLEKIAHRIKVGML